MASTELNWSHGTTLQAVPTSASEARAFVCHHLVDHRLLHLVDPIRLVVSELATNALVHGQTAFDLTLSRAADTVVVTVQDHSEGVVARRPTRVLQTSGRGLGIVSVVSLDWGVITGEGSKTVWASFATRRAP